MVSGAGARTKGHNWEREVASQLREALQDPTIWRIPQGRGGKQNGADIELADFWLECKVGKAVNINAAMRQATADQKARRKLHPEEPERWEAAVCKTDRTEPTVTMYLSDWLLLIQHYHEMKQAWAEQSKAKKPFTALNLQEALTQLKPAIESGDIRPMEGGPW